MRVSCRFAVVSAAMVAGIATAYAGSVPLSESGTAPTQIAVLAPGRVSSSAMALPNLAVFSPESQPYTSGFSPRGGSVNTVRVSHFQVWAGYDARVALHPYTSNLGPGTEPAPIQPSHYERAPFTD